MELKFTPEEQNFRADVRAFIDAGLPQDIRVKIELGRRISKDDMVCWQKILNTKGWGAPGWPKHFGGTGWNVVQQHIFEEERAAGCAPMQNVFSMKMLAPVLQNFGNGAQQLHSVAHPPPLGRAIHGAPSKYARDSKALGPEVSMLKIKGSEIIQTLAELKMHALGHDALPYLREALDVGWTGSAALSSHYGGYAPPISGHYFNQRKTTIYAGSTEVQKNIISQMILGL